MYRLLGFNDLLFDSNSKLFKSTESEAIACNGMLLWLYVVEQLIELSLHALLWVSFFYLLYFTMLLLWSPKQNWNFNA